MKYYTPFEYLLIDLANHAGLKSIGNSFEAQIKWAKNQYKRDIDHRKWAAKFAKSPTRYYCCLQAIQDTLADKPIGYLVGLDAAASGAQMIAAMMKDMITAANCGLTGPYKKDLYTVTTQYMQKKLGKTIQITRKQMKSAQMPYFYGSRKQPERVFKPFNLLDEFYKTQKQVIPGIVKFLGIAKNAWQETILHTWQMPDSFICQIPTVKTETKEFEIPKINKTCTIAYQTVKPQAKDIKLAGNITHAVDAWVMREVVRKCEFDVLVIHDEYLTHPNNCQKLRETYAEVMAEISQSNILEYIIGQITGESVKFHIGPKTKFSQAIEEGNYALN